MTVPSLFSSLNETLRSYCSTSMSILLIRFSSLLSIYSLVRSLWRFLLEAIFNGFHSRVAGNAAAQNRILSYVSSGEHGPLN